MTQRERVAENVYSFQSDVYAQVSAGAIIGPNWAVMIDTLALPEETQEMRHFIEHELDVPVRYVINTHHHADHCWGNCFFPGATVIAHTLCRAKLEQEGIPALKQAAQQTANFRQVKIVLPHLTFEENNLSLRVGKKTLTLLPLPGVSPDNIGVLVEEDRILFAGDAFMPLPYVVGGDVDESINSLKKISRLGLENVVQGHGDIVLRGEIDNAIKENIAYLNAIKKAINQAAKRKYPMEYLEDVDIERCNKSRVLIGGLAPELHRRNLRALYAQLHGQPRLRSQDDDEDEDELEDED